MFFFFRALLTLKEDVCSSLIFKMMLNVAIRSDDFHSGLPLTFFSLGWTFASQSKLADWVFLFYFFFIFACKERFVCSNISLWVLPSLKFTSQVMEHHSAGCNRPLLVACINYLGCWGRILCSLPKNTCLLPRISTAMSWSQIWNLLLSLCYLLPLH